jgi:hypothetical protein
MRALLILVALAGFAWGQEKSEAPAPASNVKMVSIVIPVHHVNVNHLRDVLTIPSVQVRADTEMHVLVVSGPVEAVAAVEEMAKKLDVVPPPPPAALHASLELTVYLVIGSAEAKGDDVPADLASTIKQLHGSFAYKSYRMVDSFVLRGRDGESAMMTGALPGASPGNYRFGYEHAGVSGDSPHSIRIDKLFMVARVGTPERPNGNPLVNTQLVQGPENQLNTSIDVREGQKVVVGKSRLHGSDDALILVVTGKVVE